MANSTASGVLPHRPRRTKRSFGKRFCTKRSSRIRRGRTEWLSTDPRVRRTCGNSVIDWRALWKVFLRRRKVGEFGEHTADFSRHHEGGRSFSLDSVERRVALASFRHRTTLY